MKRFYQYLWSAILTSLSGILCVQIDGIIVSHLLGAEAFAAIGVLMPLMQIQLTLCLLIGIGGALRLSYAVGAQDWATERRIFRMVIAMMMACSVPFVALGGWSEIVAGWFCHEQSLMPLASEYGQVLLLSAPIYMLMQSSSAMVRAEGFPKRILVAMVLANVLNLSMDMLFIAGFGWGIAGAGWATTVSNVIAVIIILARPKGQPSSAANEGTDRQTVPTRWALTRDIFLAGAPVALGSVAMFGRLSYLTGSTSAHLGTEGVIILSLLLSVFLIVNLLAGGTTQALQPLAGQYIGQGDYNAMYRVCRRSLRFTGISSLVVTALVALFANPLCKLYGVDIQGNVAISALRIFALCYAFFSLGYVLMVVHQVLGNKTKSMVIAVVQSLMVIPVYAVLVHSPLVWWTFPIAEAISLIFIIILSIHEIRQIYTTAKGD